MFNTLSIMAFATHVRFKKILKSTEVNYNPLLEQKLQGRLLCAFALFATAFLIVHVIVAAIGCAGEQYERSSHIFYGVIYLLMAILFFVTVRG